ncbi:MAG: DUF4249 domain-containing protein [Cyclobacteriaceae bacterium]
MFIVFIFDGCVDKLNIDLGERAILPIVISGFISDQPGPYTIKIRQSFNTTAYAYEAPVSIKRMTLSDNVGNQEMLSELSKGVYQTDSARIRGVAGRAYKINVELFNGKVYESIYDTLPPPAKLDTVYAKYKTVSNFWGGTDFSFDIYLDATTNLLTSYYFYWKYNATFKLETHPELELEEVPNGSTPCSYADIDCEGCSVCNLLAKCSGLRNIGSPSPGGANFIKIAPCSCCTCWYTFSNENPILSDYQFFQSGQFKNIKVGSILLDDYIIQSKIYAEVNQFSLTRQAYLFYKAIRDQKDGATSLFQPPSGKIPSNFIQVNGGVEPVIGLFYATSVSTRRLVITKDDVPFGGYPFSQVPLRLIKRSCLAVGLYPNATTTKPSFWRD